MLGAVSGSPLRGAGAGQRKNSRGLSLVEMMVGLAVGLFIVATALLLLTSHLRENRNLLLEARLLQDLRITVDMMGRQLRRASHWGAPEAAVWHADAPQQANPYAALTPDNAASDAVQFHASRDATENHQIDSNETLGFRLQNGVVAMRLGQGGWQALTDPAVLKVTALQLQPQVQEQGLPDLCHRPCPTPSSTCPPRHRVRSVHITVQAQAASDATVQRSLHTQIRLRNDDVRGQCPA
jgi:prepilin peptidase dependent protein B